MKNREEALEKRVLQVEKELRETRAELKEVLDYLKIKNEKNGLQAEGKAETDAAKQ